MAAIGQNAEGVRLFEQGQFESAAQRFTQAAGTDPHNADAYYNLASTYHRRALQIQDQAMLDQAELLYNQCLDRNENHTECYRSLAILLVESNRSDKAFTLLRNWAISNPQNSEALVEIARLHEEFGELDKAKSHLQQALMVNESNARAWTALARLREQSGDYSQALANYQRSFTLTQQPEVATRIANLSQSLGISAPGIGNGTRTVRSSTTGGRY